MSLIKLRRGSSTLVSGPSMIGKSTWLKRVIMNYKGLYDGDIEHIYYCYSVYNNKLFDEIKRHCDNVTFIEGIPELENVNEWVKNERMVMIILDDLGTLAMESQIVERLVTIYCNNSNVTLYILLQNIYSRGKYSRQISLNISYYVIFKNIRDNQQIKLFSQQLMGYGKKGANPVYESYLDATKQKYGYIFLDLTNDCDDKYRLRTHIFPDEYPIIYVPKNI